MRGEKGFSLVEMLVSAAIVAVLAVFFLRGFGTAALINRKTTANYRANVAAGNLMEEIKAKGVASYIGSHSFAGGSFVADLDVPDGGSAGNSVTLRLTIDPAPYAGLNGTELVTPEGADAVWCEAVDHDFGSFGWDTLTLGGVATRVSNVAVTKRDITAEWLTTIVLPNGATRGQVALTFDYEITYTDTDTGAEGETAIVQHFTTIAEQDAVGALFLFLYPLYVNGAEVTRTVTAAAGTTAYAFPQGGAWADTVDFAGFVNANAVGLPGLIDAGQLLATESGVTMYQITIATPNGTVIESSYLAVGGARP